MKTLQKILMPIDFSEAAHNAVKHASTLLERHSGEVVFIFVNSPERCLQEQEVKAAFKAFETQALRKTTFPYRFEVVYGDVLAELAKASERHQADLVIMGQRNRVPDVALATELMRMKKSRKALVAA